MLVGLTVTPFTVSVAEAVLPVPPLAEVTLPVVLVKLPGWVPVTVTLKAQVPPAATVAPESEIVLPPLVVKVPPQTVLVPLATVRLVGSTSVNATPVSPTGLTTGLVMVKFSDVVVFTAMELGLNALAIEGGATTTMLAEAAPPVPPSFEVTVLVVLFLVPAIVPVTFTLNVQNEPAAMVPPDKLIALVPCVAVTVPLPHEPVRPFGAEITRPAGSVSLNPIPVSPTVVLGF